MRMLLLLPLVCAGLLLAGCDQTTGPSKAATDIATTITTATSTVKEKAKLVQDYAVNFCGYLPTIASITSIFNTSMGSNVAVVGTAICNAVTNLPLADGPGRRVPKVNGVVIHGKFVK